MTPDRIPHTIHYCWFGGKPLPPSALRCIDSWRRHLPGFEIREWNENNYPVGAVRYTAQAAERGKWAFVSDYARFDIIHRHGGVYFDTDVELIASPEAIIEAGAFMGWEKSHTSIGINCGLGMGAPVGMSVYDEILDYYRRSDFVDAMGRQLPGTVVAYVTGIMLSHGLRLENTRQHVAGVEIYPSEYFCPLEDATGRLTITPNTVSIHHYDKTWCDNYGPMRTQVMRFIHRCLGVDLTARLAKLIGRR